MRIGMDARMTYYRVGGISTFIRALIQQFEQMQTAHTFTLLQSRKMTENLSDKFDCARVWTPSHHRIERTAFGVELLPRRLDVLHTTDFIPPRFGARRFVVSVHDLTFLHFPQYLTKESRRYYNGQIHAAVDKADHILTISEASKNDIVAMLGVAPQNISVQLLAADDSFRPQSPERMQQVRHQLDLPETFFLYVGTFEPRKNILGLLDAYRLLRDEIPDSPPLVLVGNRGWLYEDTMAAIERFALEKCVLVRENVSYEKLPALYSMALALVTPSFYEGFGLPALEAMSCGTIAIVSDRSSLPEVVGNTGALINPDDPQTIADAMRRAATDTPWRTAQETAARTRSKQFSWRQAAQVALQAYEKAAG